MEDGFTKEEWKMVVETKKILDPKIKLTATCVRVPVFIGHSEAVNIEFEKPITAEEARDVLREAPGVPGHRQARARRLHHAARGGRRGRRPTSAASARTRRSRTASPCGSSPTICARARRSTRCRSPKLLIERGLIQPKQQGGLSKINTSTCLDAAAKAAFAFLQPGRQRIEADEVLVAGTRAHRRKKRSPSTSTSGTSSRVIGAGPAPRHRRLRCRPRSGRRPSSFGRSRSWDRKSPRFADRARPHPPPCAAVHYSSLANGADIVKSVVERRPDEVVHRGVNDQKKFLASPFFR